MHTGMHTYVPEQDATVYMMLDVKPESARLDQIGGRKAVGCEVQVPVCSLVEVAQGSA